jgi:hypothetical protein
MKTIYTDEHISVRRQQHSTNVTYTRWQQTTEITPTSSGPERARSGAIVMGPVIHDAEEVTL